LLAASAAGAQPSAPPPAALDLARLLMQRDETFYDDADGSRLIVRLREALLQAPGGCNPRMSECSGPADAIARRYAVAFRDAERAQAELIVARFIAERMSGDEAARLAALLRSPDGERLSSLVAALREPRETARRRRELGRNQGTLNGPLDEARAVFRRETRDAPRAPPR
jgi:hypothetical protein